MEALGFMDNPGTASTWTTTPMPSQASPAAAPIPTVDPFADWKPNEVGSRLLRGRVRWGLLTVMVLLIAGFSAFGYWIYQQPDLRLAEALNVVQADAAALAPELVTLQRISDDLLDQALTTGVASSQLLGVAGVARDLFEASGALPSSETAARTQAADAAGDTLDASRLLGDAYAYRGAIIPILALPDFETDRNLIALDEAARDFGEWQLRFDTVRSALPTGTMSGLTTQLVVISGDLDGLQGRYLDALRQGDIAGAMTAVNDLDDRLRAAETMLWSGLSDVQAMVELRINQASSNIESLLG